MGTNWKELLYHRVLLRTRATKTDHETGWWGPIEEAILREVTPGGHLRFEPRDPFGSIKADWYASHEVALMEDLGAPPSIPTAS